MPLGAARTAQYANFWNQGVGMPVSFEVNFAAPGGFAHYIWPMTTGDKGVSMLNNANWDFTTTGAPTTWGSFFACMIYIPNGYFTALSGNTNLRFIDSTQFFDPISGFTSVGCDFSLHKLNTSDTFWTLRAGVNGTSDQQLTTAQTTAIQGRWIAVFHSMYDSTANYTSWTGGSGTGAFNNYQRVVFADVATGELISKHDWIQSFASGSTQPAQSGWVGASDYVSNGPSGGVRGIDIKFIPVYTSNSSLRSGNWWFAMGSTMDPLDEYTSYCQQGTWNASEDPYLYIPARNSTDWVNSTTYYRVIMSADSRFQPSSAGATAVESNGVAATPTLVYL